MGEKCPGGNVLRPIQERRDELVAAPCGLLATMSSTGTGSLYFLLWRVSSIAISVSVSLTQVCLSVCLSVCLLTATVSECRFMKLLPYILFRKKYINILALEMASTWGNRHYASCIGTLSFVLTVTAHDDRKVDSNAFADANVTRPAEVTREYLRVLDSKNYSSNVLVLEYSFNSTSDRKFQFPVPVFQINEQLLNIVCKLGSFAFKLRFASFAT